VLLNPHVQTDTEGDHQSGQEVLNFELDGLHVLQTIRSNGQHELAKGRPIVQRSGNLLIATHLARLVESLYNHGEFGGSYFESALLNATCKSQRIKPLRAELDFLSWKAPYASAQKYRSS
jgi:hypothetical protein